MLLVLIKVTYTTYFNTFFKCIYLALNYASWGALIYLKPITMHVIDKATSLSKM